MKILVTGSEGFVGKNMCAVLQQGNEHELFEYDIHQSPEELDEFLHQVNCIIHLAGVNRTKHPDEFVIGNVSSLREICQKLHDMDRSPKVLLSSSIQAELDNPYGASKRHAEEVLKDFSERTNSECVIFRLKNLFGKWSRPNYNSVTATFCHNIANEIPIKISDPANEIELTHIDDVVAAFLEEIKPVKNGLRFADPLPSKRITIGRLANKIRYFHQMRYKLHIPDFKDPFDRALYSTYVSYLNPEKFRYALEKKSDERGSLAEFIKSPFLGQIFVSHTKPGITRGDHFHHTKTEKFLVLQGEAVIRFRHIKSDEIVEYVVRGGDYNVLDIPPGYTHSIENVGRDELVTLFWANEVFDPDRPDTCFMKVKN